MAQNFYEILGLSENATPEEIEAAFKVRAREVHPDTVAPGNTHLRRVAAEAFKDLSEAKAVLLNPREREKYDAKLAYQRGVNGGSRSSAPPRPAAAPTAEAPPRAQSVPPVAGTSRQAAAVPQRRLRVVTLPLSASLISFCFVLLGAGTVFFIGWLMWSGQAPPIWLAALTLTLGLLAFRHGLRPSPNPRVRRVSAPVLAGGFVLAAVLLFLLVPSMPVLVLRPPAEAVPASNAAESAGEAAGKTAPRPGSTHPAAPSQPTRVTVDESGDAVTGTTVKIWKSTKDGQSYRTKLLGDALALDALGDAARGGAGIVSCAFHRSSSVATNWTGNCSERAAKGKAVHPSSALVGTFSDQRLELTTSDIPNLAMTPVEAVPMGSAGSTSTPGGSAAANLAGPDLSALSADDRQSIESTCASDKLVQGPAEYNQCVNQQLAALKALPRKPDLSGLSLHDADAIQLQCSHAKLMQGPAEYYKCLSTELDKLKQQSR